MKPVTSRYILWASLLLVMSLMVACGQKSPVSNTTETSNGAPKESSAVEKSSSPASQQLKKVKIAYTSPSFAFLPAFVALEKGYYQKYGLEPEAILIKSSLAAAALISGDIDYGLAVTTVIQSAQQGSPVKMVLAAVRVPEFALVTRSEIKNGSDLKGKVLGSAGLRGANYNSLAFMLKRYNIDAAKDVSVIDTGNEATMYEIIKSGQLDGAALGLPWTVIAKKEGLNVLLNTVDVIKEFPLGGIVTADKTLKERPDEVKAMLNTTLDSLNFVRDNRTGTVEVITSVFKLEQQLAEESYDALMKLNNFTKDGLVTDEGINIVMKINNETAQVPIVPISQVADFTLLKEVLQARGIK